MNNKRCVRRKKLSQFVDNPVVFTARFERFAVTTQGLKKTTILLKEVTFNDIVVADHLWMAADEFDNLSLYKNSLYKDRLISFEAEAYPYYHERRGKINVAKYSLGNASIIDVFPLKNKKEVAI